MNLFLLTAQRGLSIMTSDRRGQTLVEYGLMAGFVTLAAGAVMPDVATDVGLIFSTISSALTEAAKEPMLVGS
jgi:Flp pilus assembly pilin Flp